MAMTRSTSALPTTPPMMEVVAGPELELWLESGSESVDFPGRVLDGVAVVDAVSVLEGLVDVALGSAVALALVWWPAGISDWSSSIIHSSESLHEYPKGQQALPQLSSSTSKTVVLIGPSGCLLTSWVSTLQVMGFIFLQLLLVGQQMAVVPPARAMQDAFEGQQKLSGKEDGQEVWSVGQVSSRVKRRLAGMAVAVDASAVRRRSRKGIGSRDSMVVAVGGWFGGGLAKLISKMVRMLMYVDSSSCVRRSEEVAIVAKWYRFSRI